MPVQLYYIFKLLMSSTPTTYIYLVQLLLFRLPMQHEVHGIVFCPIWEVWQVNNFHTQKTCQVAFFITPFSGKTWPCLPQPGWG